MPATFTVTNLGDEGVGSGLLGDLRYTVNTANANPDLSNRIVFQPGLTGAITLTRGMLSITKNLEILGPGADVLTVSGNFQSGVFHIPDDPRVREVRLSDLTVTGGVGAQFNAGGGLFNTRATVTVTRAVFTGNVVSQFGGGIYNQAGTMVLDGVVVASNRALRQGGIFNGGTMTLNDSLIAGNVAQDNGGISNRGTLTINRSTVADNVAEQFGGGIDNGNSGPLTIHASVISGNFGGRTGLGGGLNNFAGQATVSDSVFVGNFAGAGGGIWSSGMLTLTDSTVAFNRADALGGGIDNRGFMTVTDVTVTGNTAGLLGGGISNNLGGTLTMVNATVSGNVSSRGAGLHAEVRSFAMLTACTITLNSANGGAAADGGGGILVRTQAGIDPGQVLLRNTLVADNAAASAGQDVRGVVQSLRFNLVGRVDDSSGWHTTDRLGTVANPLNPRLGPLQDNGGPTLTHAVLRGSPAVAAGDTALMGTFDQRGTSRSNVVRPDIGAFQAQPLDRFRLVAPAAVAPGEAFDLTVVALDRWGNTASTYAGQVHFSSSDLDAVLPPDTFFAAADGGVLTVSATLMTPGRQTIAVSEVAAPFRRASADVEVAGGSRSDLPGDVLAALLEVAPRRSRPVGMAF